MTLFGRSTICIYRITENPNGKIEWLKVLLDGSMKGLVSIVPYYLNTDDFILIDRFLFDVLQLSVILIKHRYFGYLNYILIVWVFQIPEKLSPPTPINFKLTSITWIPTF